MHTVIENRKDGLKCNESQREIVIHIWEKIWHRLRKSSPYTHYRAINELINNSRKIDSNNGKFVENRVHFLLRVDDFPRWDLPPEHYIRFDSILAKFGIEYCLGVTPRIAKNPLDPFSKCEPGLSDEAADILKNISNRVEIALHGLTHRVRSHDNRSEYNGLKFSLVEKNIVEGLTLLCKKNLMSFSFIPPFNSISTSALPVLARHFKILFGGPESIATLGFHTSPSALYEMIYLPSYPPAYDRANNMINFVKHVKQIDLPLIIPLTIHWAWEESDNFNAFEKLCQELSGWTISLTQVIDFVTKYGNSSFG
jgi:hypothetical protein